jgi:hypothetical protein
MKVCKSCNDYVPATPGLYCHECSIILCPKTIGDINSNERGSGARYNAGKTRYDLIPLSTLKSAADVFEYGTEKYAPWNWAKGMEWTVPYACLLRHLDAWFRGEDNDPESGLPHIGHALCNLIMLAHYRDVYQEGDNRPKNIFQKEISK